MPFENTIELWGFVIKPIHVQIGYLLFLAVFGVIGTYIGRRILRAWRERGNRQFDHYLDTITTATEPDAEGYRVAQLRNLGSTQRIEIVIRGNRERGWMLAAANQCDWDARRFIKDPDPERQERILHIVRNALTRHFAEGEVAHLAGLPTKTVDLYFSPTGADAAYGGVRMIRTMIVTGETLQTFHAHPPKMWRFEKDKVTGKEQTDHEVRVRTIRDMADAVFNHGGYRSIEDTKVMARIVGWMQVRVPCRPEEAN